MPRGRHRVGLLGRRAGAARAREVISFERIEGLAAGARAPSRLGVDNVEVVVGDGSLGAAARGPFEGIAVHAAGPRAPQSLRLPARARREGGDPDRDRDSVDLLTVIEPQEGGVRQEVIGPCRFVPLIGEEGFEAGP